MPKLAKVPEGMCRKCKLNGSWYKSLRHWCYWCEQEQEQQNGNQSLQRPTNSVSANGSTPDKNPNLQRSIDSVLPDETEQSFTDNLSFRKQAATRKLDAIRRKQKRGRLPKQGPW